MDETSYDHQLYIRAKEAKAHLDAIDQLTGLTGAIEAENGPITNLPPGGIKHLNSILNGIVDQCEELGKWLTQYRNHYGLVE